MQHFQSILIVIGLLAIGGVLIHGYLLSRKDKLAVAEATSNDIFAEKPSPEVHPEAVEEVFSEIRIISNTSEQMEESIDFSNVLSDGKVDPLEIDFDQLETVDESETLQQSSHVEPSLEQLEFDTLNDEMIAPETETAQELQPQDLFIFNVVAKEGIQLGGHELLQFFLTSGFRFGEMSIFHRHVHSDGNGAVLFSIANMMAPGVFDPDNMEQFKSEGVSFFLTAPNKHIDIKESFEMMLRAVQQMADEFDCIVLNAAREPMTEEQFIDYNQRLLHYI